MYVESGRRLWAHGEMLRAVKRVQLRMHQHMEVMESDPMRAGVAIAAGASCGALAFASARLGTSFVLQSLRISSQNHIAATAGGAAGVFVCGGLAAHTFLLSSTFVAQRNGGLERWPLLPVPVTSPSFVMVSVSCGLLSLLQFRLLLGGRLRFLAPSDVIRPGTFAARGGLPLQAPGNDYADQAMKRLLSDQGAKHGCHSCGRSKSWWGLGPRLNFIGDHIPPNKYAKILDAASGAR